MMKHRRKMSFILAVVLMILTAVQAEGLASAKELTDILEVSQDMKDSSEIMEEVSVLSQNKVTEDQDKEVNPVGEDTVILEDDVTNVQEDTFENDEYGVTLSGNGMTEKDHKNILMTVKTDENAITSTADRAGVIASGQEGNITWMIDMDGKLTLNGSGDYSVNDIPWFNERKNIISAEINVTGMTTAESMFAGCSYLKSVDFSGFDTSNVESMNCMFMSCSSLETVDFSGHDTSNVKDMGYMFYGCGNLRKVNLGGLDTGNVKYMYSMFGNCRSLEDVNLNGISTRNVINISGMFLNCKNLKNLDVSGFDTRSVTYMEYMFRGCSSLKSLDVSNFDTTNVSGISGMFMDCGSLENLNLNGFNTPNTIMMDTVFAGCGSLKSLDVSSFNTSQVFNMTSMFAGCANLTSLDVSNFNVGNVVEMMSMFQDCKGLAVLDLSNFNVDKVEFMIGMFDGCDNLETIYAPYNVREYANLPVEDMMSVWLLPDGTAVEELPYDLSQSVMIVRYKNPQIITTTPDLNMKDVVRVKYVPYSYTVQTNNWDPDNIVTYSIEKGTLAKGLQMYSATGEIYGVPLETGTFPITVKATFSNPEYLPSYKDLTLTVLDNTDSNVLNASDPGYEVEQYIGTLVSGSYSILTELTDQLFVSAGSYGEFIDFWLNGEKLVEGRDYTKEEGSTRITIRSQTFKEKANRDGVNTIAAEFRVGGDTGNALKRTAQNFRIDERKNESDGYDEDKGNSGSESDSDHTSAAPAAHATAIIRLSASSGSPFAGLLLELHSTPMEATTDANGVVVFNNVEEGWHTLYVKTRDGKLLASKGFELLFGDEEKMDGDLITVKAGSAFTVNVRMDGDNLSFININGDTGTSVQETADVQQKEAHMVRAASTGDSADFGIWFVMFVSCGLLLTAFFWRERKRQIR